MLCFTFSQQLPKLRLTSARAIRRTSGLAAAAAVAAVAPSPQQHHQHHQQNHAAAASAAAATKRNCTSTRTTQCMWQRMGCVRGRVLIREASADAAFPSRFPHPRTIRRTSGLAAAAAVAAVAPSPQQHHQHHQQNHAAAASAAAATKRNCTSTRTTQCMWQRMGCVRGRVLIREASADAAFPSRFPHPRTVERV